MNKFFTNILDITRNLPTKIYNFLDISLKYQKVKNLYLIYSLLKKINFKHIMNITKNIIQNFEKYTIVRLKLELKINKKI